MNKKTVAAFFIALPLQAALALFEKKTGLYGVGFAFALALVYCKVHPVAALPSYAFCHGLIRFDPRFLAVIGAGVFLASIAYLVAVKTKKKQAVWVNILIIIVSEIPVFFLYPQTRDAWMSEALGPVLAAVYHGVAIAATYPVTVRSLRYGRTERERLMTAAFVLPIGAGIATLAPFGVSVAQCLFVLFAVTAGRTGMKGGYAVAACAGLGATLTTGSATYVCIAVAVWCGAAATREIRPYLGGAGAAGAFVTCMFLWKTPWTWQSALPLVFAAVGFLPDRVFKKARLLSESYHGRFALRTAANREREEVAAKLRRVCDALLRAKSLLESERGKRVTAADIADAVRENCCRGCGKYVACREKIGDARPFFLKAAASGMETGRVTYLDLDGKFSSVCVRIPRVLNAVGEQVRAYREALEKRTGTEQGRDVAAGTLEGTAELLCELAASVDKGFGFDVEGEKRIREELACANVVASDAAIYEGGEKITLTVRECDEKKPLLTAILSEAVGRDMYLAERRTGVNGNVDVTFKPGPEFGVLYGVYSHGAEEECGDATEGVRIADDKVMFVLSDGMGTGKEAKKTGASVLALIETFYKAGFGHSTVFGCVSKLLSLRNKESFSALDVGILDTQNGEFDFIKQGGRESYVLSGRGVEKVEGGALPMGILDECEPVIRRCKLTGNELVVMLSDGVADVLTQADLMEIVGNEKTLNPQVLAEKIVLNAVRKEGKRKDDVTALVVRVVKR